MGSIKAYELSAAEAAGMAQRAEPGCYRCHGRGVKKWKRGGLLAVVCDCVEEKLATTEIAPETRQVVLHEVQAANPAASSMLELPRRRRAWLWLLRLWAGLWTWLRNRR